VRQLWVEGRDCSTDQVEFEPAQRVWVPVRQVVPAQLGRIGRVRDDDPEAVEVDRAIDRQQYAVAAADIELHIQRRIVRIPVPIDVIVEQVLDVAEPIGSGAVLVSKGVPRPEHRIVQGLA
jgi:hypothetical protein